MTVTHFGELQNKGNKKNFIDSLDNKSATKFWLKDIIDGLDQ